LAQLDLKSTLPQELFDAPKMAGTKPDSFTHWQRTNLYIGLVIIFLSTDLNLYGMEGAEKKRAVYYANP